MAKQKTHTLAVMRPPARLGDGGRDVDGPQLLTAFLLVVMRHRIRHHQLAEFALLDHLAGVAREDRVRDDGDHLLRVVCLQRLRRFGESAAGIRHVIHKDRDFVRDVADEDHTGDFVRAGTFLVNEGEIEVETIGDGSRTAG